MLVKVTLYAVLADIAQSRRIEIDLRDRATAGDMKQAIEKKVPALRGRMDQAAVAVNREVVGPAHVLAGPDEIAILPPVSGG